MLQSFSNFDNYVDILKKQWKVETISKLEKCDTVSVHCNCFIKKLCIFPPPMKVIFQISQDQSPAYENVFFLCRIKNECPRISRKKMIGKKGSKM